VLGASGGSFVNFEGKQTSPLRLSPDGSRLFAVNTADNRLSVFDVSHAQNPVLIAEIPVGLEPVSVNPLNNDEAWVVNEVSDSVSIVSVNRHAVTGTLYVQDEPARQDQCTRATRRPGNVYQKMTFTNTPGAQSIAGFGLVHDGSDPSLFAFLSRPVFGVFANNKPAPSLRIASGNGVAVVAWTTNAPGYVLEKSATLPPGAWNPDTNVRGILGGEFTVTNSPGLSNLFFRLREL